MTTREWVKVDQEIPPLTTHEISRYMHVDFKTVINWCEEGKLRAYKTPGGHRRVQPENFLDFLRQYEIPIPKTFEERMKGILKILIVDDETEIRKVIRRTLKKNFPEAAVYEAQDGFEAGKMLLDALPHLVILDLKLPGIDGFRVCSNIKNDERLKETKILAITGQNTEENKQNIIKEGADDFLPKPFDTKDLTEKIIRLLQIGQEG